jgi:hypothetical protein
MQVAMFSRVADGRKGETRSWGRTQRALPLAVRGF